MFKAIIFDLDGTLVYTSPEYRYRIVSKTLRDFGVIASNKHIDGFWFEARRDEIIRKYFRLEPEVFWEKYRKYDTTELRKKFTRPYRDVEFIRELKLNGYKIGIVTGAPNHIIDLEIRMIGKENFDAVVRAHISNGINPKPYPHGLERCLNLLKVPWSGAVYVGNSDEDVLAAKNAGVFDVLVDRKEYRFNLKNLRPSMVVDSLYDLEKILKI